MYFDYHLKSSLIFPQIESKYPWLFHSDLSPESQEARYYLLKYLEKEYGYTGLLEKDSRGKPLPLKIPGQLTLYWSISHSRDHVAYIVSDMPTGIDISLREERDESLLDIYPDTEYTLLGEKNWDNFFLLWTAKEAIIKCSGMILDDMKTIILREKVGDSLYTFVFQGEIYKISTLIASKIILSYIS